MQYVKIVTDSGEELLQEINQGAVVRYCSVLDGVTATFEGGSTVVNADYPTPAWATEPIVTLPEPAPAPQDYRITRLAFRERFTTAEKVALELASLDDPSAAPEARQMKAALRVYMKDLDSASWVDLQSAATRGGVTQLEMLGLIADGRATEILDAPVRDEERPSA